MRLKSILRVATIAATTCLFGALPAMAATTKPLVIGISFQELNNPYFVTMNKALHEAAATIGAKVYVTDAHHDITKQLNDISDMIQRKIDILILNPTDTVGIAPAVEAATNAGVVVVAVDAGAKGPIASFVGSKNYDAGKLACTSLANAIGGSGNIGLINGIPVLGILQRVQGCRDAIAAFPNIKIVANENGQQDRVVALGVATNMISAHPDLKGIFSVNDGGALGVYSAIKSSGKDIKLTSVDGAPEAIAAILEHNSDFVETSAQFPQDEIRLALGVALAKYWGASIPAEIPVHVEAIDKTNAQGFHW